MFWDRDVCETTCNILYIGQNIVQYQVDGVRGVEIFRVNRNENIVFVGNRAILNVEVLWAATALH